MSQDMIWKITVIVLSLARSFKIGGFYFYLLIKVLFRAKCPSCVTSHKSSNDNAVVMQNVASP